jgi:hypothetical protein
MLQYREIVRRIEQNTFAHQHQSKKCGITKVKKQIKKKKMLTQKDMLLKISPSKYNLFTTMIGNNL